MTDHVRTSYRNHRRTTWGLVIAVVVASAAVLVPLATGAGSQKFYTVGVPPELCSTPTRQTLTLTLSNQTRNQNLGSANITAPAGIALVSSLVIPGVVEGAGGSATISVNVPDQFSTTENTIRLRNLALPTNGSTATITVAADVTSGGTWATIGKQSNSFADAGPGNLFTASGVPFTTNVSQCQQNYVFVQGPVDAERGSAQTVKVQLQSGGVAVPVSGALTLTALQGGNDVSAAFNGLTASPDAPPLLNAGKQWTFSVTGNVSGTGYALRAGSTISSPTFSIAAGLCPPNTTDNQHLVSTCSLTSNLNGGILESGVTINNHKLPGSIAIDFEALSEGAEECDPWTRASYTVGSTKYYFPGVSLDFEADADAGLLTVVYRVRNADWVRTAASRGNNDIEICAGARHGVNTVQNDYPPSPAHPSGTGVPFIGKYGAARWDEGDGLFWGVLASVANPSKVKSDPVVCGGGTQDLATGPNGAVETWRTWTICIPFDWDWKNF